MLNTHPIGQGELCKLKWNQILTLQVELIVWHVYMSLKIPKKLRGMWRLVRAGVAGGGFMNETEPELDIDEWAEMDWQRVVREKLGQEKF